MSSKQRIVVCIGSWQIYNYSKKERHKLEQLTHLAFVLNVGNTGGVHWSSGSIEIKLKVKQLIFQDLLKI